MRLDELFPRTAQLSLGLDWSKEPWNGFSPRWLRRALLNVEKSRTFAKPATVAEDYVDPAQLTMFLQGTPYEQV